MGRLKICGIVLLAGLSVVGCGGVKQQAMQHGAGSPLQSIALLSIGQNDNYVYEVPMKANTTIGRFSSVNVDSGKDVSQGNLSANTDIISNLHSSNYNISQSLMKALKQQISQKGIAVMGVHTIRNGYDLLDEYKKIPSAGADAILDVSPVTVGFKGAGENVFPLVQVQVRLVSARTREVLYQDTVRIGDDRKSPSLANERHYVRGGIGGLLREPGSQLTSLDGAATTVATYIASQLRP
jgi:hypothetical protein